MTREALFMLLVQTGVLKQTGHSAVFAIAVMGEAYDAVKYLPRTGKVVEYAEDFLLAEFNSDRELPAWLHKWEEERDQTEQEPQ